MSEEFDVNKVAAEFVTSNINRMGHLASGILRGASTKIRLRLRATYLGYLERLLARYSRTKSFLLRSEAASLYEFYVPMNLTTPGRRLEGPGINDVTAIAPRLIVTGSAGSGKSVFFRHLLLDTVRCRAKVPIFVELRHFNQTKEDLRRGLAINLENNGFDLSDEYIEAALKDGHFAIFLDGFDELAPDVRTRMISDVQLFAQRYHNNWVLVSSRPDYELEGWQDFSLFKIDPLNLKQAEDLIGKLPFDDEIKVKFLRDLRKQLFTNHQSFLSNPLLLSIMLLTYGQVAHIPSKLNVFYNQAYEALFQRHDAFKGGFQRERRTGLDIQDFAQVFSLFCIQGYDKKRVEYSRMDALDLIGKAKQVCGLDFDNEDYLHDALQAVCLLLQEGLM